MKMKETLFPVMEIPASFTLSKETNKISGYLPENTGWKFIVRQDKGDIISCVTDKYKMITNHQLVEAANPILKEIGAILTEEKSFANGARSNWTWKIPDIKVKIDNKDYVNPTLTLRNSYDGSVQLHILAGAFRLVCSNGLVIGTTISNKVNKHSIYNLNLEKIDESIKDTVESIKTVFKNDFPVLVNTEIQSKHVHYLLKMFPDFSIDSLTQYLLAHKPHTFWDLLNAATWVATHAMKRDYESTHKLETKIFPSITRWANQAAKA